MATSGSAAKPYFFLSYVHDEGSDDASVRKFFGDLHHDVQLRSGFRRELVGFCDTTLRVGDRWSPALVEALCTCTAFVPLCSPTYFRSSACGKEWWIFRQRMAAVSSSRAASPLVPLKWIVPFEMPEPVRDIQYLDGDFGDHYARLGLRDLIEIPEYQRGYRTLLNALALRITELANTVTVPPYRSSAAFDDVEAAFPINATLSVREEQTPVGDATRVHPRLTGRPHLNPYLRRPAPGQPPKDEWR